MGQGVGVRKPRGAVEGVSSAVEEKRCSMASLSYSWGDTERRLPFQSKVTSWRSQRRSATAVASGLVMRASAAMIPILVAISAAK